MSRAERRRIGRGLILALVTLAAACRSGVVFAERHASSQATGVLRVAEERGLADGSTSDSTVIEIPLEVRSGADTLRLPGCALQAFRSPAISGSGFAVGSIVADPDIRRSMVPASDSVVPPGRTRVVTLRLAAARIPRDPDTDRDAESLGVRVDETTPALYSRVGCVGVASVGAGVQHYGLRRMDVEPLGLGALAAAGMVIVVLAVGGR